MDIMNGFRQSHAVVIGINGYGNGIPPLRTAVNDARRIAEILETEFGYAVQLLTEDVTLAKLSTLLGEHLPIEVQADDRLLVYFAGHGIALDGDDGPAGYLVPQDARSDDRQSFLPMTDLSRWIERLPCRHLLLVLDCCFAGAFRWCCARDLGAVPGVIHKERFDRYIRDPAWQVITSAAYDQKALDVLAGDAIGVRATESTDSEHSPFAAAFLQALKGEADLYPRGTVGDGVITASELHVYLRGRVDGGADGNGHRQTPSIWPLKKHDKGEYIHLVPGHELNLPPAPELNEANNPYRGLQPYDEEHASLYCGRKHFIKELAKRVAEQPPTVVLGSSGTGKSSVVKAGLLSHLLEEKPDAWQILPPVRPGKSPLASLASLTLAGEDTDFSSRLAEFWTDPDALATRVGAWTVRVPAGRLLLVVDQFEELITRCRDASDRDQFLRLLDRALAAHPDRFRVVLTLRSDFEPRFADALLPDRWKSSTVVVPAMTLHDFHDVIEEPASVKVLYFKGTSSSQAFINRLIGDVNAPGGLALLSSTLHELYCRYLKRGGDDRSLWEEDYEQLGGVDGLVRDQAKILYEGLPDDLHRETMRRVMLRMTSVEAGSLARRRVADEELVYGDPHENARVAEVLHRLTESRLVVKGKEKDDQPYVEPAHDKLVRCWDNFLKLSPEEAESLKLRRRLAPAATAWAQGHASNWATDPWLGMLDEVLRSADCWLNAVETRFIRRSWFWRRAGQIAIVAAFLVLSVITGFAYYQKNRAETEAHIVSSRQMTALASQELDNHEIDLALLLSVHAIGTHPTPHAHTVIYESLSAVQGKQSRLSLVEKLKNSTGNINDWDTSYKSVNDLEFSPDGKTLFAILERPDFSLLPDGIVLWDLTENRPFSEPRKFRDEFKPPDRFSLSPDGKWLATAGVHGVVQWKVTGHGPLVDPQVLIEGPGANSGAGNSSIAYSPDGNRLAAGFTDNNDPSQRHLMIWDVQDRSNPRRLLTIKKEFGRKDGQAECHSIAFSPDGKKLAAGFFFQGVGGQVPDRAVLWDISEPRVSKELFHVYGGSNGLAFFPDGTLIVGVSNGVHICDRGYSKLEVLGQRPTCMVVSRNGATLAVGSDVGMALWDVVGGRSAGGKPALIETRGVQSVAIDAAGKILAVGSADGIILFDIAGRRRLLDRSAINRDCGKPMSLVFCPDGVKVASDYEKSVVLWQVADGGNPSEPRVVSRSFNNPTHIALSFDCARLAATFAKADEHEKQLKVVMFNMANGSEKIASWSLEKHHSTIFTDDSYGPAFTFSPDGTKLALVDGHVIEFLNTGDGRPVGKSLKLSESRTIGNPHTVAFNRNGSKLAVGRAIPQQTKGAVVLMDVNSGNALGQLLVFDEGTPTSLAFDPEGSVLAIGFRGFRAHSGVVLWDLIGKRRRREPLAVTEGSVTAVAFSPDGAALAVGYVGDEGRGGVLLWDMDVKSWIRRAQDITRRNFSWDEWGVYFGTDVASYKRTFPGLQDGAGVAEARQVR